MFSLLFGPSKIDKVGNHMARVPMIARRKRAAEYKRAAQELAAEHNVQAAALTARIDADSKLSKDLRLLTKILGWNSGELVHCLLDDARRFSPGFGVLPLYGIDKDLAEAPYFWTALPKHAINLADEIEKANRSKLSPAHTLIHRDAKGEMLSRKEQERVAVLYKELPKILRSWALELNTKVDIIRGGLAEEKKEWPVLKQYALTDGLEERVFAKSGKYHETPLYRLLSAAAGVMGIHVVTEGAFRVRLNRQRKALRRNSKDSM
jgi:hypothetical protein